MNYCLRTVALCLCIVVTNSISLSQPLPAEAFVDILFVKYGTNNSMDATEFKRLLKDLAIGTGDQQPVDNGVDLKKKCLSARSLLDVIAANASTFDKQGFGKVCPALVQQVTNKVCSNKQPIGGTNGKRPPKATAWGYSILSVFIISCASLVGALVVPFMGHVLYRKILMLMVSLAVGVLGGSGLFHLIPSALGLGKDGDFAYLYKCGVVMAGIYVFFVVEYSMKMYVRFTGNSGSSDDGGQGHSHGLPPRRSSRKEVKPTLSLKTELPEDDVAAVKLEMYKPKQDHHGAHSNSVCTTNEMDKKPTASVIDVGHKNPKQDHNCAHSNSLFAVDVGHSDSKELDIAISTANLVKNPEEKPVIAPVAWMIIIGDSMHNFLDGLAIGAAFSSSIIEGISTSLAIFCEEFPHELGDFAVLLNGGMSYKQALIFNFMSACTCFVGVVIGLLLGYSTSAVKWIYSLAGGMFIYISLVDMLPEANEMSMREGQASLRQNIKTFAMQNFGMLFGFATMFVLALYAKEIRV